jgi:hypothetical protein
VFNESETDVPLGSTGKLDALAALARGIAVRNYLTSTKGIDIERVNVKALGNKNADGGPGDRVDLFVLK